MADPTCPTCGSAAAGRYCAECGERFLGVRDFELRHFLAEHVTHEMLEFDGKLPRSMRVLFTQPGQLALDYVAGRRKPYVSPLRLYLVAFVLHLFLMSLLAAHPMTLPQIAEMFDPSGFLLRLMAAKNSIDWAGQPHEHFLERVHWISQALTLLVFLGVAGIQSLLLIRLHRHYLEHLTLALTVSAFYLLMCVGGDAVAYLFWHEQMQQVTYEIGSFLGATALPLYWCLSVRRFYRISWPASIATAAVLTISTALLASLLEIGMLALIIETS